MAAIYNAGALTVSSSVFLQNFASASFTFGGH